MKLDEFMIWRFKTTDGVLDNIKTFNVTETTFNDGSKIEYDMTNEIAKIDFGVFHKKEIIQFKNLSISKLKEIGFIERTTNRNVLSYTSYTGNFEK